MTQPLQGEFMPSDEPARKLPERVGRTLVSDR